ncbi:hypothetical protein QJ856_gp0595 [Tupanvirus deep ocean]|uniref:Uncharacterized protein n=2 Tax=Tupanvirus TaxID=2094720 RepID=A0AC62A8Q0_9VIRU|nr:hypothetical protein QJ856_gp0595 [Tupanvirus deep ocean]QKU34151.1 hypothetical protein [Tupanvirus deep ocean]
MSSVNILFFSNHCEGSKQLLSMLESEKLTRFFHLICTDNNPNVPPQIKVTPTLIIRGIPTPYVAGDAFAWLAKVKQWKFNLMMQRMSTAQQQYLQSINNNLNTNDTKLLGFSESEMNGMSDIFSFFARDMSQECQDALPQSFFLYNMIGKEFIETKPLEDGTYNVKESKCKITKDRQKEMLTNLEMARKQQDDMFKQNIDNFRKQYGSN